MAAPAAGGAARDLLPTLEGHVESFRTTREATWSISPGSAPHPARSRASRRERGGDPLETTDPVWESLALDRSGMTAALAGEAPAFPREAFALALEPGSQPLRLTDSNPWLKERRLARRRSFATRRRTG